MEIVNNIHTHIHTHTYVYNKCKEKPKETSKLNKDILQVVNTYIKEGVLYKAYIYIYGYVEYVCMS